LGFDVVPDHHMLGPVQLADHFRVVDAAEPFRNDHGRRLRFAEDEPQLALPVAGKQRIQHRSDAEHCLSDRNRLPPGRQLDRHHVAGADPSIT
jgi:hypothetical protein